MSGIEIAGLVLGALPVLIRAVDLYKDGIRKAGTAFRKRKYVQKLARALLLQQQTLEETVKSVLIASGSENIWRLDEDPLGYLNEKSVREQVLDYLGAKNDVAFTGTLEQSKDIVKKIARNLAGLVPTFKVRSATIELQQSLRIRILIYSNRIPRMTCLESSGPIKMRRACSWTSFQG